MPGTRPPYPPEFREQMVSLVKPYEEATFRVSYSRAPHEIPSSQLLQLVERVVDVEGPIHVDEIARWVAACCGLGRAGSRIRQATKRTADYGVKRGVLLAVGSFLQKPGARAYPRDRSNVRFSTLRKSDMLPPQEIREAVRFLVTAHVGMGDEEVARGTARLPGFKRTGSEITPVIIDEIRRMLYDDVLRIDEGRVYLAGSEGAQPSSIRARSGKGGLNRKHGCR